MNISCTYWLNYSTEVCHVHNIHIVTLFDVYWSKTELNYIVSEELAIKMILALFFHQSPKNTVEFSKTEIIKHERHLNKLLSTTIRWRRLWIYSACVFNVAEDFAVLTINNFGFSGEFWVFLWWWNSTVFIVFRIQLLRKSRGITSAFLFKTLSYETCLQPLRY